jgi:protein-disulfide isomerase
MASDEQGKSAAGDTEAASVSQLPPSPPVHGPASTGTPVWTYFLTPLAVVIGAIIVAGAIWWTDDDNDGDAAAANVGPDAFTSAPGDSAAATSPTGLLSAFTQYATQLSLDTSEFQQCLGDQERAASISAHLQRGQELGVTGTPTFFINNKMVIGAQPLAIFQEVIDRELSGSPASIDEYSDNVKALAATSPPRFAIVDGPPDVSGAYIEGEAGAKVMIAEYSDFQCPFCQRWAEQALPTLRQDIGEDVAIAFMHFPITQIHPNAGFASFAAICAGEQGEFWGMHDILFARQAEWANLPVN